MGVMEWTMGRWDDGTMIGEQNDRPSQNFQGPSAIGMGKEGRVMVGEGGEGIEW